MSACRRLFVLALVMGCSNEAASPDRDDLPAAGDGSSSAGGTSSSAGDSGGSASGVAGAGAGLAGNTGELAVPGGELTGVAGQATGVGGQPPRTSVLTSSGVCGFTEPVAYGPPGADGMVDVPPADPNIFYLGRVACDATGPAFAFPAVSVRVRFQGDALDLRLRDSGTGTATSTNYYDVSIDGGEPTRLDVTAGDQVYPLARDLGPGEHGAQIVKRVESGGNSGKGQLLGFRVREGTTLLPVAAKPLLVEFVGDSITCGYGNEVSTTTPEMFPFTTINENANAAYGAVAARLLDAEYVAVAISGRGVYRNYSDGAGELAPSFYEDTLPDDAAAPPWDFARYVPDVVVVNLGTNDFSPPGPDHAAYRAAYSAFLKQIRAHHPDALLLAVVGTMLNDGFPPGVMAWTTNQSDVSSVVAELTAAGDGNVHYLALTPQTAPFGEDYHPTRATHQQMAEAVANELRRLLPASE
jgi:lysophospholipase L1-like esterase